MHLIRKFQNQTVYEGIENIEYKDIEIANQLNFRIKLLGITEIINNSIFEEFIHAWLTRTLILEMLVA